MVATTTAGPPLSESVIVTLFNGTLPQLVTIPLKLTVPLGQIGDGLQILVTEIQGLVQIGQLRFAVEVTLCAGNGQVVVSCPGGATSVPAAVTEMLTGPHPLPEAAAVT